MLCAEGILLSNGKTTHKNCLDELLNKIEITKSEYYSELNEINKVERKLNSRTIKLLNYFFVNSNKVALLQKELENRRKYIQSRALRLNVINDELKSIYDYWLDYPPDWDERRKEILNENSYCQECLRGYERNLSLHIHHKIAIAKGGNHRRENLIVLCDDCHQSKHKHKFSYSFKDSKINPFEKKLYLLREAVEKQNKIHFHYVKFEGERSIRTFQPQEFKKVGESLCVRGFCYLRNDYRTFAIKRMSELKIVE